MSLAQFHGKPLIIEKCQSFWANGPFAHIPRNRTLGTVISLRNTWGHQLAVAVQLHCER